VNEKQVDLLVVGGGLTGASLMLALADTPFTSLLVEARTFDTAFNEDFEARTLALSPSSIRILKKLQVWPLLESTATPIKKIHISEQARFGRAILSSSENEALGYVVAMHEVSKVLHNLLRNHQVMAPAKLVSLDMKNNSALIEQNGISYSVRAKLIVAADGAQSLVRQFSGLAATKKIYAQQALVANIALTRSHSHCAYERFTASGPLAMLPMQGSRMSMVWAMEPEKAALLLNADDSVFLKQIQQTFGYKLGRFTKVSKKYLYPLEQVVMPQQAKWPLVFVGNAAHTLHPVAGQGFNLGLRDIACLAQCIIESGLNPEMLKEYLAMRAYDQKTILSFTNGLIELFTSRIPGVGLGRRLGLIAVDNSTLLKKILTHHACGFAGIIPDLVCTSEQ
jgi:2-octaprenyl-6-methoxyphenol hydroxylase